VTFCEGLHDDLDFLSFDIKMAWPVGDGSFSFHIQITVKTYTFQFQTFTALQLVITATFVVKY